MMQEINAIEAKSQVGKQKLKVKLELFETCLLPAILHGPASWGDTKKKNECKRGNTKQSTKTIVTSPNININCGSTNRDRRMAC